MRKKRLPFAASLRQKRKKGKCGLVKEEKRKGRVVDID